MNLVETQPRILICEDDDSFMMALRLQLRKEGCEVFTAKNADEAMIQLKAKKMDLVLLDIYLRSEKEGLDYLPRLRNIDEDVSILMLTGLKSFEAARDALKMGAQDYISKDAEADEILHRIRKVLGESRAQKRQAQILAECSKIHQRQHLVGNSAGILQLRKTIEKLRNSPTNVLITGETGTGKEVVARLLRAERDDGSLAPFVAVDSATIHAQTAESILFGHEKGAFTGADKAKRGVFEEADGGIVYFDEIGNMTLEIQSKLLRVLQEKEVTRLGGAQVIPLDFRVIAATNKNLEEMVKQGTFKEDLLQRLNVVPLQLAPLRERKDDIPLLIQHFIERSQLQLTFDQASLDAMVSYDWPGNVRELSNVISYLGAMVDDVDVQVDDLPPKIRDWDISKAVKRSVEDSSQPVDFYGQVAEFERELLRREYLRANGKISLLASKLSMDRSHLYTKLKIYGLHEPRSKTSEVG